MGRLPLIVATLAVAIAGCSSPPVTIDFKWERAATRNLETDNVWSCNTPGGDLMAGLIFAYNARQMNATTVVRSGHVCGSAGAIAWLGGARRIVEPGGRLVFHGPINLDAVRGLIYADVLNILDVSPVLRERLLALKPGEVWHVQPGEVAHLTAN